MNGGSPLNPTLSPSLNFGNSSSERPTNANFPTDLSSTLNTGNGNLRANLIVHKTSLKSRVETQIPIKLSIYPLPPEIKKLRLPRHSISKPKFFAKPDTRRSPEILELHTSVVCSSAMQDKVKLDRAFARARGEQCPPISDPAEDRPHDYETPLEGGEVKICGGCIQRERKRASRKKQRQPEEDELFQKDEEKRVIVFNTTEMKDWQEPPPVLDRNSDSSSPPVFPGSMQVELPMRIACYCRHQNEKLGFR